MREKVFSGRSLKCLNLHYGARFYDPAVARWWVTDKADEYHSPYIYVGNSPLLNIDPDGNFTDPINFVRLVVNIYKYYNSDGMQRGDLADAQLSQWFDNNNVSWWRPERIIHNGGSKLFSFFGAYNNSRILEIHLALSPFTDPYDSGSPLKPHWETYSNDMGKSSMGSWFVGGFADGTMANYLRAHNIDLSGIVTQANSNYFSKNSFFESPFSNTLGNAFLMGAYNLMPNAAPVTNVPYIPTLSDYFKINPEDWDLHL